MREISGRAAIVNFVLGAAHGSSGIEHDMRAHLVAVSVLVGSLLATSARADPWTPYSGTTLTLGGGTSAPPRRWSPYKGETLSLGSVEDAVYDAAPVPVDEATPAQPRTIVYVTPSESPPVWSNFAFWPIPRGALVRHVEPHRW